MPKIKNGGLDQCGAEPFEQQRFGIAGAEGVNTRLAKQQYNMTHFYCKQSPHPDLMCYQHAQYI